MRFPLSGVCLLAVSLLAAPTMVSAIELTDYKFPESTSHQAYLNGSWVSTDTDAEGDQAAYNLAATSSYDFFHRSLPYSTEFHFLGSGNVERGSTPPDDSDGAYDLLLATSGNKYFNDVSDTFGYGRTRLQFRAPAAGAPPDEPYWDIAGGLGYGRTIDATVLKQALRMQEDFKEYGVIKQDIPDDALMDLAGIIDREREYESRYGTVEYRKYWYEDMEEVIRRSGALEGDALGAMGLIRIQEILDEPTGRRFYGWEVRGGLGVIVSNFAEGDEDEGDMFLEGRFNWARPVGLDLQFNDGAAVTVSLSDDPVTTLENLFQLYYEISNRIDWDNRLNMRYDLYSADALRDVFTLTASTNYIFYLENRLSFTPSFAYNLVDDGVGDANWNWTFSGNISYRLR